jgi:tetratricopeptide (TPR) repeat protein
MKKLILFFVIAFNFTLIFAQTDAEKAEVYYKKAIDLMDNGSVEESITFLELSIKLNPEGATTYNYEIALAYSYLKEYKKAIKILKSIIENEDAFDLHYSLMGTCYDMLGNSKKAIESYKDGLSKFPKSGKIYLELGVMDLMKEDFASALINFESGIEVEPIHPSNYFWASRILLMTDEQVWGMIYGEIFINLERNTDRTAIISKELYNTYKSQITFEGDTGFSVSFSKTNSISIEDLKNQKLPFGVMVYETTLMASIIGETDINLESLNRIRTNFVNHYFDNNLDEKYPNILFDWQKQLVDSGYFEAYNNWLLKEGEYETFKTWTDNNEEKFSGFANWYTNNTLIIDEENYFLRTQYD